MVTYPKGAHALEDSQTSIHESTPRREKYFRDEMRIGNENGGG